MIHAELEDEEVDRIRRYARCDHVDERVEAARSQLARGAHAGEGFLAVEPDLAGVLERRRIGVEIADHVTSIASTAFRPRCPDVTLYAATFKRRGFRQKKATAGLDCPAAFRIAVFRRPEEPRAQLNLYFAPMRTVWKDGVSVKVPSGAPNSGEKSFSAYWE